MAEQGATSVPANHQIDVGSADDARASVPLARGKRRASGLLRSAMVFLTLAVFLGAGLVAGSFFRFASMVSEVSPPAVLSSDGIVVLTGGSDRITQALHLFKASEAKRLLISGVHPQTTREQIVRTTDSDMKLFECCVDLDRKALNTTDNARETAKWAHREGFSELLVVTSSYHMPRSLLELQAAMPDITLVPYPVVRDDLDVSHWYVDGATTRLLLREYVKYMVARFRTEARFDLGTTAAASLASD
ncbi:YdcF family protein [Stappia sediminis]|nr:YdcF family protein [Stappia sediminis]